MTQDGPSTAMYFNPRSREGSDSAGWAIKAVDWDFNPRSREGSDPVEPVGLDADAISIHAPVKGATGEHGHRLGGHGHFNPRSREGSDRRPGSHAYRPGYFNPRSREGSDVLVGKRYA